MAKKEGQRRCRTCGESYDYPGYKSQATRARCENCVQLPPQTQRVLELFRRRLEQLERAAERAPAAPAE